MLLQELLTKNQIDQSRGEVYKILTKYFPTIREYLFNNTGLQLVQVKNSYKMQFEDDEGFQITKYDTPITYEIYFLILASLITKKIDEKIIQKELADEIIPLVSNTDEEIDKIFSQVISYLVKEKYLSSEEMVYQGQLSKVLTKRSQPAIYLGEDRLKRLSPIAEITKYLLTHQSMNKLHHPQLWERVTDEDLKEHFEKLENDNYGYKVFIFGNTVRAISKNDKRAFPNLKDSNHRIILDIIERLKKGEEIRSLVENSPYKITSTKVDEILKIINEYNLLETSIEIERSNEEENEEN